MRSQEKMRLRVLARKLDDDIQYYDTEAFGFRELKEQMLKKAGLKDKQMEKDEFVAWEGQAQYYDSRSFEEKVVIPEGFVGNVEFLNCLVLQFSQRHFKFAVDILSKTFKGNFMSRTDRVLRIRSTVKILWFMGLKETTNRIQDELSKHSIWFRVLRDSYFRRDFAHYHNGRLYALSRKQFRELTQKASLKEEREKQKIIAQ